MAAQLHADIHGGAAAAAMRDPTVEEVVDLTGHD
jgi:hypothetical protein